MYICMCPTDVKYTHWSKLFCQCMYLCHLIWLSHKPSTGKHIPYVHAQSRKQWTDAFSGTSAQMVSNNVWKQVFVAFWLCYNGQNAKKAERCNNLLQGNIIVNYLHIIVHTLIRVLRDTLEQTLETQLSSSHLRTDIHNILQDRFSFASFVCLLGLILWKHIFLRAVLSGCWLPGLACLPWALECTIREEIVKQYLILTQLTIPQ